MKTIIRNILVANLIFFVLTPLYARADDLQSSYSPFSVRIRPVALAFGIFGAEVYYENPSGYFLGLTAHFFEDDNSDKNSSISMDEFGLKFGKFFGHGSEAGWWVQGGVFLDPTKVTNLSGPRQQSLSANFLVPTASLTAGYQFRMIFVDPDRLNVRLGTGIEYAPAKSARIFSGDGRPVTINLRNRFDPSIEFTLGYLL